MIEPAAAKRGLEQRLRRFFVRAGDGLPFPLGHRAFPQLFAALEGRQRSVRSCALVMQGQTIRLTSGVVYDKKDAERIA